MIVDTDVLIWASRGNVKAAAALHREKGFHISVVTYMEIFQGIRNRQELNSFNKALRLWSATVLQINEEISQRAMFLVERYALSHSCFLSDGLVAATAIHFGQSLLTANVKHYGFITGLDVVRFRP